MTLHIDGYFTVRTLDNGDIVLQSGTRSGVECEVSEDSQMPSVLDGSASQSVLQCVDEWQEYCEARGLRQAKRAANSVRRAALACHWKVLSDAHTAQIDSYMTWLKHQGRSAKTCNCDLSSIRQFFRWARRQGRCESNPCDGIEAFEKEAPRTIRRAMTLDQLVHLIHSTKKHQVLEPQTKQRRELAYLVAASTGIRKGALLRGIRIRDLKLIGPQPYVRIPAHLAKNKLEAHVPLTFEAAEELSDYIAGRLPDDHVFPFGIHQREFDNDLKRAGIHKQDEEGRVLCFHSLRHSYCTALALAGVDDDVRMRLMTHRSVRMTQHYTDNSLMPPITDDQVAAVSKLARLNGVPAFPAGVRICSHNVRRGEDEKNMRNSETQGLDRPTNSLHNGAGLRGHVYNQDSSDGPPHSDSQAKMGAGKSPCGPVGAAREPGQSDPAPSSKPPAGVEPAGGWDCRGGLERQPSPLPCGPDGATPAQAFIAGYLDLVGLLTGQKGVGDGRTDRTTTPVRSQKGSSANGGRVQ